MVNPAEMKDDLISYQSRAELVAELLHLRQRLEELEALETQRQQALEAMRAASEKYRLLLDESSDPIFMFSPEGEYRYVNQAFAEGVGKPLEKIIGYKIWDVFPPEEAEKRYAVVKWVFEQAQTRVIEVRVPRQDGDRYYITTVKPVFDAQQRVVSVICISKEITERKHMEDALSYVSTHDALTGLYNRLFFESELVRLQVSRLFPVSVLIADIDDLKLTNDRAGHAAGDELIRQAARALQQSFRAEEVIARIGGDEFVVLLPRTDETTAAGILQRLQANLADQVHPRPSLSIGRATCCESCDLFEALRQADDRMYQEKARRKAKRLA